MRVLFDHQIFLGQKYGGVSRYFYELANGLAKKNNHDVRVIAPFHQNEYLRTIDSLRISGNYFNQSFRGSTRLANYAKNYLLPISYALNGNMDIIHETYYSQIAFGRSKRRVVTVYDMIHEIYKSSSQYQNDRETTINKFASISRADHVICISESTKNDLINIFNIAPSKISVVYLGYSLTQEKLFKMNVALPKRPYLLFVGRRDGYKNFSNLCYAYASSSRLVSDFDIVAFGGGTFNQNELELLAKLSIEKNVIQLSGPDSVLASYYANAELFIYPSLYEGFGIPPLEAMSYGCPVTCSNTSSIPEVVGDAGCYFDPESVISIIQAIEKVAYSLDYRLELRGKGLKRLALFSWEKCVNQTSQVYSSLL